MGKTFRIWRKKPNPERLHFFWNFPIYREEKKRISCIHKSHRIRNEWWKTLRHYNKSLCKRSGMRWKVKTDADKIDEYFNVRYFKADYIEFFD